MATLTASAKRTIWLTVGFVAALWCAFMITVFVLMALVELLAPDSVASSGPSPVLVIVPWVIGLYLLARWAFRQSDRQLPEAADQSMTGILWRFEHWAARHPIWRATLAVIATLISIALFWA